MNELDEAGMCLSIPKMNELLEVHVVAASVICGNGNPRIIWGIVNCAGKI